MIKINLVSDTSLSFQLTNMDQTFSLKAHLVLCICPAGLLLHTMPTFPSSLTPVQVRQNNHDSDLQAIKDN